ncbi:hypothetical protein tb265_11760 [Gemmatimonadetes bacterium T265]|nr:hypothetical protein tb265_11760 [Gemmatimonadetes bacterium T265]
MRAAVLAFIVLGACGRGDAGREPPDAPAALDSSARDATPRGDVTPPGPASRTKDTPTPARPDSVPGSSAAAAQGATSVPDDTPPRMRNARLPFRYPGALYARRAQGDVTLRLWVDASGRVRPESTRVAETSGVRLLDSAAVAGSVRLDFTPARHAGHPVAAPLLFPVHFRHPAAAFRPG